MLLACSVDTPIHINRFRLLASRVLCGLGLDWAQNISPRIPDVAVFSLVFHLPPSLEFQQQMVFLPIAVQI